MSATAQSPVEKVISDLKALKEGIGAEAYVVMAPQMPDALWDDLEIKDWIFLASRTECDRNGRSFKDLARERILTMAQTALEWWNVFYTFRRSGYELSQQVLAINRLMECQDITSPYLIALWVNMVSWDEFSPELKASILEMAFNKVKTIEELLIIAGSVRDCDQIVHDRAIREIKGRLTNFEDCMKMFRSIGFKAVTLVALQTVKMTARQWVELAWREPNDVALDGLLASRVATLEATYAEWDGLIHNCGLSHTRRTMAEGVMATKALTILDCVRLFQMAYDHKIKYGARDKALALAKDCLDVDAIIPALSLDLTDVENIELETKLVDLSDNLVVATRVVRYLRSSGSPRARLIEKIKGFINP